MSRAPWLLGSLLAFVACEHFSDEEIRRETPENRPGQQVMSWVSVWGIEPSKTMFDTSFGAVRVLDTLDRVGLQFWTIDAVGEVGFYGQADAEDARWFVERGHANGKKILGTIVNGDFDWELTRGAFENAGGALVAARLGALVDEYDLDGIDVDFETGQNVDDVDRAEFARFVEALGEEMRGRDKLLTINSFYAESNGAPGPLWWSDWLGHVDTIQVMGYDFTWWRGPGGSGYQALQDRAVAVGYEAEQLSIGFPAWTNSWGEIGPNAPTHVENLRFVTHCLEEPTGVAIWSLREPIAGRLPDSSERPWSSEDVWQAVLELHEGVVVDEEFCRRAAEDADVVDDMSALGKNRLGGIWLAVSDYWDRPSGDTAAASRVSTEDGTYDVALGEGTWGKTERAYGTLESGHGVITTRMQTLELLPGGHPAYASWHMEFLERDCELLEVPSDGCGWRPEALVERDLSDSEKLVVALRCDAGEKLHLELQSREGAIAYARPFGVEVECTGEFEDYELVYEELVQASTSARGFDPAHAAALDIRFVDAEPPSDVSLEILGVALDESVVALRGLR